MRFGSYTSIIYRIDAQKLHCPTLVDKTRLIMKLASFLLYVSVLYFFCSLALTVHKTQKVLKCRSEQLTSKIIWAHT